MYADEDVPIYASDILHFDQEDSIDNISFKESSAEPHIPMKGSSVGSGGISRVRFKELTEFQDPYLKYGFGD